MKQEYAKHLTQMAKGSNKMAAWFRPPLLAVSLRTSPSNQSYKIKSLGQVSDTTYFKFLMKDGHGGLRGIDGQMRPTSLRQVIDTIGLSKSDIFLDVGHGVGSVFFMLHFWDCAPSQMLGIEFDPTKAINSVRKREQQEKYFEERGRPMAIGPSRLRLMCGDILDMKSIEPATVILAGMTNLIYLLEYRV